MYATEQENGIRGKNCNRQHKHGTQVSRIVTAMGMILVLTLIFTSSSSAVPECAKHLVSGNIEIKEVYKGEICYFVTTDNRELWCSDGTDQGTLKIVDLCSTCRNGIKDLHFDGNYLYINPINSSGMWISDGTTEGSVHIPEMNSI